MFETTEAAPMQGADNEYDSAFPVASAVPRWSVVLPFHNERDYLAETLRSLAAQSMPFHLILVDNASTDESASIALSTCRELGIKPRLLTERRPGKVAALQCGVEAAQTELIATCDADTLYPRDYLARAAGLLDRPRVVAAIAATAPPSATMARRKIAGYHLAIASSLLPQQCLNGGAGQVFRAQALKAAGSFDPLIWNWVLEDHEIMARIERHGSIAYHADFQCAPSLRPRTGINVSWRFAEQLRYHATTPANRLAFFHAFLSSRLRTRALTSDRLRRSAGYFEDRSGIAALHPLRR